MQTFNLTNLFIALMLLVAASDAAKPVAPPVPTATCSINKFPEKPDFGLSGTIVVSPRSKGGIYITGYLKNAPVSTTGIIFIGTDTDCSTACVETGDVGRKGGLAHEDLCLGGRETGGKPLWSKMTYTSDSLGAAVVSITQPNMEFSDALSHCVVVQAADESRIGCGELK
jgi:hypothetical protein